MHSDIVDTASSFGVTESRLEYLFRTGRAKSVFLQGVFPFAGRGFFTPRSLNDGLFYEVPEGATAQIVYFRAGNLSDDLVYLTIMANGDPIRYFPVAPKGDVHVRLAIVETQPAGTKIEVGLAAQRDLAGSVVVDVGIAELPDRV